MTITVILCGLAVGSFLNVCIDRLPRGQSLLSPRSRCDGCGTPLAARDLVPVVSYLLLRGRCRYCGASIPVRVPFMEIAAASLFGGCALLFGNVWAALAGGASACALLAATVIAIEHHPLRT
ncbi:MAG: prepilin peptidase [Dehalococcoidia bacterium]|jgi:leader peptidase (prepilin peptidase)/N-methyltransferase